MTEDPQPVDAGPINLDGKGGLDLREELLTVLKRLETGQGMARTDLTGARADLTELRTDLMARLDRLQDKLGVLDEHLTMGLGNADRVEEKSDGVVEQNRILSQQMLSVQKLLRMLEARINALEERPRS